MLAPSDGSKWQLQLHVPVPKSFERGPGLRLVAQTLYIHFIFILFFFYSWG